MMDLDIINSMSMKVVYCILLFFKNRHFTTTVDSERQGLDSKFGCQRIKLLIYLSCIVFYPKWDFLLSNWEVYNPFSCWTPREKAPLPSLWGLPGPQQSTELRDQSDATSPTHRFVLILHLHIYPVRNHLLSIKKDIWSKQTEWPSPSLHLPLRAFPHERDSQSLSSHLNTRNRAPVKPLAI